jgi:hypothetical protein
MGRPSAELAEWLAVPQSFPWVIIDATIWTKHATKSGRTDEPQLLFSPGHTSYSDHTISLDHAPYSDFKLNEHSFHSISFWPVLDKSQRSELAEYSDVR